MILAECCGTMGLSVTKTPNLSERVCIPCRRKVRNAAELYRFVAISAMEDMSLTSFCNVEDIAEKAETHIKVVILYPNDEVAVQKSFDKSAKSLITNLYHAGHGVRGIKLLQFSRDLLSKVSQSETCVCQRTQK